MQPIKIGLIGGSGLGAALASRPSTLRYVNTPFGKPSDAIHEMEWAGVPVLALARHGAGHRLNPTQVPYRANLFALKVLGCTHVLATGAVGSLREEYRPRDVVVPDQAIDRTFRRAGTFFENAAVHVEMGEPFCPVLRQILREASDEATARRGGSDAGMKVHHGGCYVAMEGPSFSTRAESLMNRLSGGDLIGMTAMPEARLAKEAELPYALVTLVTDYDSWRPPTVAGTKVAPGVATSAEPASAKGKHELLGEIIANLRAASENATALLEVAVERIARNPTAIEQCPASNALELAVWSDRGSIDEAEIERLRPLWGRHFRAK